MVAADPLRVGQQETRERFTINAVLPDFFALKIMRSRDTMNRTFKRRMGQLLQAMFKRDFPGDIEGRAHQPRTKLIRGRSEGRRVGKEGASTCRSGWSAEH